MTLKDWVAREGTGAITRLSRESGLAYTTVLAAVHGRSATRYATAKLLSDVTGGAVSIDAICARQN